jgi:hypothetical protein
MTMISNSVYRTQESGLRGRGVSLIKKDENNPSIGKYCLRIDQINCIINCESTPDTDMKNAYIADSKGHIRT